MVIVWCFAILLWNAGLSQAQCDDLCDKCEASTCAKCKNGSYWNSNLSQCLSCSYSCKKCTDNSSCISCVSEECDLCLSNCINEECDDVTCTECIDGFYPKYGYCFRCEYTGCKCESAWRCNECLPGRYGDNCPLANIASCPNHCNNCSGTVCVSCAPGYFGHDCASECPPDCLGKICNRYNGNCAEGCNPGTYGVQCHFNCPSNCKDNICNKVNGYCTEGCISGYFFENNVCHECQKNCSKCTNTNDCHECFDGFYVQSNDCKVCFHRCLRCNNFTSCSVCKKDYYWGEKCEYDCVGCSSDCSKSIGCYSQCDDFYYKTYNEINGWVECNRCPEACQSCKNSTFCDKCKQGLWGNVCQHTCNGCKDSDCDKHAGCISNCTEGYSVVLTSEGSVCIYCPDNCQKCSSNSSCVVCTDGYYSSDKTTCQRCSAHCKVPKVCDSQTGVCLDGCEPGWYGKFCNEACIGNCNGSVCNRNDGQCTFGCAVGFVGEDCVEVQDLDHSSQNEDDKNTIITGVIVAASIALSFVVFLTVLLWIRRRYLRRRLCSEKQQKGAANLESFDPQCLEDDPTYNRLEKIPTCTNDTETVEPDVIFPSQAEIKDKSQSAKKPDIVTLSSVDNINTCLPHSNEEYDDQSMKEEEMLEELAHAGEAEPSTYYNTTGRRVTVGKLSKYIENRPTEDILEEFKTLPMGLCREKEYSSSRRPENISKNRYKFIYPYDESRVVLKYGDGDYINASYIEGFNRTNEYIGAMGPFKRGSVSTVMDFWRMVWQEQCETIVMLTNLIENEVTKCEQYWPSPGTSQLYGTLHVACLTEDEYADFVVRTFRVRKDAKILSVRHLHFTAWPDKTVPEDVTSMIEFRQKVRSLHGNKTCPIVVHCSAGIGRTGTFIALDILTFEGEARGYIDIYGCVATIRSQRVNLVQTPEQYVYLYHSVVHALTFDCRSVQADMFIEYYRKLLENTGGQVAIEKQFEKLHDSFARLSIEEGSNYVPEKSLKNKMRKGADVPDTYWRVELRGKRKEDDSDFINAVFVNGFRTSGKFIVTQIPLPHTVIDFLSMILQESSRCVVMMDEPNLQDKTIGIYWPADNQAIKHGVFEVSCLESRTSTNFSSKKLQIMYTGQKKRQHEFHLYLYTQWPNDRVVPRTPESLLELIKTVDMHRRSYDLETPIIVHCMTGSEKSCLYCAVSLLIEKIEIEHEVSVVNTLRQIKARRKSAIPCLEQYKFCHEAIICFLQSFDVYSNFGLRSSDTTTV